MTPDSDQRISSLGERIATLEAQRREDKEALNSAQKAIVRHHAEVSAEFEKRDEREAARDHQARRDRVTTYFSAAGLFIAFLGIVIAYLTLTGGHP